MVSDYRKPIVAASVTHMMIHVFMLILPQVLRLMQKDLSLSLRQMGLLANIAGLTFGLWALPAGLAADRFGAKRIIPLTLIGMAICSLLIPTASRFWTLAILFALLGTAGGFYHPAGISLISWVAPRRGPALGFHGIVGNIGFSVAPFLIGTIAVASSWRTPYLILGTIGLLLAGIIIWCLRQMSLRASESGPQAGHPRKPEGFLGTPEATSYSAPAGNPTTPISGLILVCAVGTLTGFVFSASTLFLPTYLMETMQRTSFWARAALLGSLATSAAYLMGVLGQYVGGDLAEKVRLDLLLMVTLLISAPILVLTGQPHPLVLLPSAMAFAFLHFLSQPVTTSLVAEFTPVRWRGFAYGIFFFSTYGFGSFASTFSAYIAERYSLGGVFLALAVVSLLAAILTIPLFKMYEPIAQARAVASHRN